MPSEPGNVRALLEARAASRSSDAALTFATSGARLTYGELARATCEVAAALAAHGARPGDRIALVLGNTPEMVLAYLATMALGAIATPLNGGLTRAELTTLLAHAAPRAVLVDKDRHALVAGAAPQAAALLRVRLGEPAPLAALRTAAARVYPTPEPPPAAAAMMLYTSGTSGRAKGALLTHANLLANARDVTAWLGLGPADRLMCVMPLFHANGLVLTVVTPLLAGAPIVLCERFSARRHWEWVARFRATTFGSVATMLSILLAEERPLPREAVTSLRFVLCGSAPVPVEIIRRFEARFGVPVIEGYGLTEATCRATFNPIDGTHRPGSAGLPIGNELRITGTDGRSLPPEQVGEIRLRGPNVMAGYFQDPAATRAAIDDGWLRTGDLARVDRDGFVWIVDRLSDMIIRGGENVYPREIDEVLYAHPAVADAVTYGVPDPTYGEEVEAVVVLRPGHGAAAPALLAHCRERLAAFKAPKRIVVVDAIPKGPTGKLLRRAIQAERVATRRAKR